MQKIRLNIQLFASGTISSTSSPSAGDVRITWSSTANTSNNTSSLTATVQIKRASSGTTTGTFSGSLVINGTSYSISKYGSWTNSWTTVGSKTVTITHNENGSKSLNINTTLSQTGTSMAGTYKASGTATLDTINRASKLNPIDDFKIDDTIELSITKYIGGATDNLSISIGNTTIKSVSGISNGYQLTFSSAEQSSIIALMTSPQIEITFTLTTINEGSTLGTSVQKAVVTSLSQPLYRNVIQKLNGHYQVAINGIVDDTIDDVMQVYDDNGNLVNTPVVLYNSSSGSNGTILLNDSSANYKYIEIYFADNNGNDFNSVKVYDPNGKNVGLMTIESATSSNTYIRRTRYTFSGSSIVPQSSTNAGYVRINNNTVSTDVGTNYIKIYRVVGYN